VERVLAAVIAPLGVLQASLFLLPVVMVCSMSGATMAQMKLQADEISTLASGIRHYHADKVIARLQAADGQAQLQERSIFASVADDLIVGISIADMRKPDTPLIDVNNAFTTITGCARELAIGCNCRFLQGPDTEKTEPEKLRQAIREGESSSRDLISCGQGGSRFCTRLTPHPIRLGESSLPDDHVAHQVDVTSLKRQASLSSAELAALSEDLEHARRSLADVERFSQALRRSFEQSPQDATEPEALLRVSPPRGSKPRASACGCSTRGWTWPRAVFSTDPCRSIRPLSCCDPPTTAPEPSPWIHAACGRFAAAAARSGACRS
jgi:PAS domain-containing protein